MSDQDPPAVEEQNLEALPDYYLMLSETWPTAVWQTPTESQDAIAQNVAQTRLRESEARLIEAQRIAQLGSWEWDLKTNAITWSDGLYRIYGRDPATFALTYENIMAHILPEDMEVGLIMRERTFQEKKEVYEFHLRIRRADGKLCYLHNRNRIVYDEAGAPTRILGTSQDETKLRLAEAQIVRKVEQLAALNEMGQVVVSHLEPDLILAKVGEKTRALLHADTVLILLLLPDGQHFRIEHVSGRTLEPLLGREVPLTADISNEALQANKAILVQGYEEVVRRASIVPVSGSNHPVAAVIVAPMRFQEQVIGLVAATHDQEDGFALYDLFVLETAAAWASIAISHARLYEQLQQRERRLRELAEQLIKTQEEERQRAFHELHDEVAQSLTVLKLKLEMLAADLADKPLRTELSQATDLTAEIMQRIRLLAYELRPPELETIGLDATLRDLCWNFANKTAIQVEYNGHALPPNIPDVIQLSFYRFLQEVLSNVSQHTQATRVKVRLTHQRPVLSLKVEDNGQGFDRGQETATAAVASATGAVAQTITHNGLGLLGIKERFEQLGGSLTIESGAKTGTTLIASVTL